jgi:hypothetical protein
MHPVEPNPTYKMAGKSRCEKSKDRPQLTRVDQIYNLVNIRELNTKGAPLYLKVS